jgi:hypothetical protein
VRISYLNRIDDATLTVSPAASSDHPVANLQDQRLSTVWEATSTASQEIAVDLGSARAVNTYAVIGHNFTEGTSIICTGGSTTACSAVTSTLAWNEGMILLFAASETYRYWKFTISGSTSIPSAGRIWLGTYLTIDPSSLLDFTVTKKRSDYVSHGPARQKYSTEGIGWRAFDLSFPPSEEAMVASVKLMHEYAKSSSVIFANFDTIRDYAIVEPCYCSMGDLKFKHTESGLYTYGLSLEEEL